MALNITSTGGEAQPYVKYNAKADKWFVRKEGASEVEEIGRPTFIADMEGVRTGWFLYAEGQAPNIVLDPNLTTPAPKPSDMHKRGFEVMLFSQNAFGGAALLSGSSMHICNAFNELYEAYEKDRDANKGKLPVVECTGSAAQKDKFGTNYRPSFAILKWVDRPNGLGGTGKADAVVENKPAAASSAGSEF